MKEEYNYITMIERAVDVMELIFSSGNPLGVTEIAHELELPKATVYRILITLSKGGLITKKYNSEKYILGGKFIKYSERVKQDINIWTIAKPFMEKLSDKVGETVNLAVDYENASLIIERVKGEQTGLVSKLLPVAPYNCSSSGKIFLSYKTNESIKEYFDEGKAKTRTIKSIINLEEFIIQQESILENGFSIDDEEYDYGLFCIGEPVFTEGKKLLAVLSISGPKSRIEYKGFEKIKETLRETVADLEYEIKRLGIKE